MQIDNNVSMSSGIITILLISDETWIQTTLFKALNSRRWMGSPVRAGPGWQHGSPRINLSVAKNEAPRLRAPPEAA